MTKGQIKVIEQIDRDLNKLWLKAHKLSKEIPIEGLMSKLDEATTRVNNIKENIK